MRTCRLKWAPGCPVNSQLNRRLSPSGAVQRTIVRSPAAIRRTMANGVEQGLTASVWTQSHSRALRFLRELDFGAVSVNAHAPMASELPHGGFGSSGYGRDLGLYGLDDYTRIKHIAHAL